MAICKYCQQEMLAVKGCWVDYDEEKRRPRLPFGKEKRFRTPIEPGERCHDCGVAYANYHHPGCDMEECAGCGEQRLLCPCEPTPRWMCPNCQANLEEVGATEVEEDLTTWFVWSKGAGLWQRGDEVIGDDGQWSLECEQCHDTLPYDLQQALWQEIEQDWAAEVN